MLVVIWDLHPGYHDKQGTLCKGIRKGTHMSHIHWITFHNLQLHRSVTTWYWLTVGYYLFASVFNITYSFQSYHHWFEWIKWLFKMCLEHKGSMLPVTFYTFPSQVIEDKITPRPSNVGSVLSHVVPQIISWIWKWLSFFYQRYHCRMCHKVSDCKPNL